MTEVVIVDAVRTPIGRFLGRVSQFSAVELGATVIRALKERNRLKGDDVDEVIMGNVVQAGLGQAPARQAMIFGGLSPTVPAVTVNKVCGSGLKAVIMAAQAIRAGDAKAMIAGGMESMSNAPFLVKGARAGFKYGDQKFIDAMIYDGLWSPFDNCHMGLAAEYTAEKSKISRADQDRFAYESHQKAIKAIESGRFAKELIVLEAKDGPITQDESPRADTSLERLAKLKPAFKEGGTVTAGNAPGLNDGAAALFIMSADEAKKRGYKPLAKILDYAAAGTAPLDLFYAPIESTRKLLGKLKLKISDFDLIEINEAFASQALADGKELEWDWSRVNVNGGAVALGHPIGASGARILTTLLWTMQDRNAKLGLVTICMGGGNGLSLAVQRLS
ncbi:acetyl-CoA C-acetyltransferase [Candidatus Acetothermia bacterium]|jgi:acetyl-CoA C-acetyltransferase|nr:acetyl-CoA C-acetyltransferase [Candidatus Acetothermia bacterium]MCI2431823.1 acetyl-CoA C-acetyltransferase [Candidatus Acetothermia bacterium]MCI2435749.1 acetyl-CoA C-acetyltransferase [Candidatus Acetothermia bacterium]